jgi:hypothetical protein
MKGYSISINSKKKNIYHLALAAGDPLNNEETEAEEADRKMAAILPVRTSWSNAEGNKIDQIKFSVFYE